MTMVRTGLSPLRLPPLGGTAVKKGLNQTARPMIHKQRSIFPAIHETAFIPSVATARQLELLLYAIRITIKSNYGHPTDITCSEIDPLDENNRPLPVVDIKFEPNIEHITSPKLLVNSDLIKEGDEWKAKWTKPGVAIVLVVASPKPPSSLRIWNSRSKSLDNIKDVSITVGETFVNAATIPQNFGLIVSLAAMDRAGTRQELMMTHQATTDEAAIDKYGELPIPTTKLIKIQLLQSKEISDFCGLGAVEIFTVSGKKLSMSQIKHVQLSGAEVISGPQRLFREEPSSIVGDSFVGKRINGETPQLDIEFISPVAISLIRITNIDTPKTFDSDFSLTKLAVIPIEGFYIIRKMPDRQKVINIWLTDSQPLRRKANASVFSL